MNSKNALSKILFSFLLLFFISPHFATPQSVTSAHTEVVFIPEFETVQPGTSFWVALEMKLDPDWHVYWQNPGDSGLPTTIAWDLPEGIEVSSLYWPVPHRIPTPPYMTFGFEGAVYLFSKMKVSDSFEEGTDLTIRARVDWLSCKEICIPGEAELSFPLKIRNSENILNQEFEVIYPKAHREFPLRNLNWKFQGTQTETEFQIELTPPNENKIQPVDIFFYPYLEKQINNAAPQILEQTEKGFRLTIQKDEALKGKNSDILNGVLVSDSGWLPFIPQKGAQVSIPVERLIAKVTTPTLPQQTLDSFYLALFFAFLGGLILNLMPCVLPVLSLKILGLIEHISDPKKLFREGILFSAGVLVSFWVLAGVLIFVRFLGTQVGWGFQFQSPAFLILMSALFFWLALNLFGLFEIGTSLTTIGNSLGKSDFLNTSFFNGILATIVATPCTAPFMGSALGYALIHSSLQSFFIFTALGLGMAFPYLLLTRFPQLLKFIPKPGSWMIQLKRFFGLLFLATVFWLGWVLKLQRGSQAVFFLILGLGCVGLAAWLFGKNKNRFLVLLLVILGVGIPFLGSAYQGDSKRETLISQKSGIAWEAYSKKRLNEALLQGKPVFLDFTAAWCLSCQVNERVAFHNKKVIQKFKEYEIVSLKADWTNYDPEITKALSEFGKASVPFYVFYVGGKNYQLPEIITPNIVLDYLEKVKE